MTSVNVSQHTSVRRNHQRGRGAPVGNCNAVTHGRYVGGRKFFLREERAARNQALAAETWLIGRLEREAFMLARGERPPASLVAKAFAQHWRGNRLRKTLMHMIKEIEVDCVIKLCSKTLITSHFGFNYQLALKDALCFLCERPKNFASEEEFLNAIRRIYLYVDDGTWDPRGSRTTDPALYRRMWRVSCANLFEYYNPRSGKQNG